MRAYLNAGFGKPIGAKDLALMKLLGYAGPRNGEINSMAELVPVSAELLDADCSAILILGPSIWQSPVLTRAAILGCSNLGLDAYYELGNELDKTVDPVVYASAFCAAEDAVRAAVPQAKLVTAGITSTTTSGLLWLHRVLGTGLISNQAIIGYHTYRSGDPDTANPGFASRYGEFNQLHDIVGTRQIAHTEAGWSDAKPNRNAWPCTWFRKGLTEAQVADYLMREIAYNAQAGAETFCTYQLNDGLGQDEHFGIRRVDGTLKPSAGVLKP